MLTPLHAGGQLLDGGPCIESGGVQGLVAQLGVSQLEATRQDCVLEVAQGEGVAASDAESPAVAECSARCPNSAIVACTCAQRHEGLPPRSPQKHGITPGAEVPDGLPGLGARRAEHWN